jgi:hypothetical protein
MSWWFREQPLERIGIDANAPGCFITGGIPGGSSVVFRTCPAQTAHCGVINFIGPDERTNEQLPNR